MRRGRLIRRSGWRRPLAEAVRHVLRSAMDVKAYPESVGRAHTTVHNETKAARVAAAVDTDVGIAGFFSSGPTALDRAIRQENNRIDNSICYDC
jgi:hypothetical protein